MSTHISRFSRVSLALAAAALVAQSAVAAEHTAAEGAGDVQQQVSALLAGTTVAHASRGAPRHVEPRHVEPAGPRFDAQQYIGQVLLSVPGVGNTAAPGPAHAAAVGLAKDRSAAADLQAAVQSSILGKRSAAHHI